MKRAEMPNATRETSYPSPTGAQMSEGGHPFFASQHPMSSNDDLRMSGQQAPGAQLGRAMSDEGSSEEVVQSSSAFNLQGFRQEGFRQDMVSPQQLAQSGLESVGSSGKPRSKVSRACDECRRKKMRCDSASPCTNCMKAGITCAFAQPPGKRGPSKGYIKQLADRVDLLEGNMQYGGMNQQAISPHAYNAYSTGPEDGADGSRKRTHSMSEGVQNSGITQCDEISDRRQCSASTTWTNHGIAGYTQTLQTPTTYQSQPLQQKITYADTAANSQAASMPTKEISLVNQAAGSMGLDTADARAGEPEDHPDVTFEWNEQSVDEYYRLIHPILPILPTTKARMIFNIAKTPATMRDTLIYALNAAAPAPGSDVASSIKKAAELLVAVQLEDLTARPISDNLVYLQALLLMSLAHSASGPKQAKQSSWINLAFNVATFLKLHLNYRCVHVIGSNIDTKEKLCRRAWLAFVVIDRWHAAGTGVPQLTGDSQAVLHQEDTVLLSDTSFRFARISMILGHIVDATGIPSNIANLDSFTRWAVFSQIPVELEREFTRDVFEPLFASWPSLNLAYWHVMLLIQPYTVGYSHQLNDPAGMTSKLATMLYSTAAPVSPFAHHFAVLATTNLFKVLTNDSQNKEAKRDLEGLWKGLKEGRILRGPSSGVQEDKKSSWNSALADLIGKKLQQCQQQHCQQQHVSSNETAIDRGGLQHLADAAVGESENLSGEKGKEAPATVPEADTAESGAGVKGMGYLNKLFA